MKSADDLARRFASQWENPELRESRLLGYEDAWPISLPIGQPSGRALTSDLDAVRAHVRSWRQVRTGRVIWEFRSYRAAADPVEVPLRWELRNANEWVEAGGSRTVRAEFVALSSLVEQTDPIFHPLLIRRRSLWRGRAESEVVQAAQLALLLAPGCAEGRPLRLLSVAGIDTKFFERNGSLVAALLDVRFDGEASNLGLAAFLGALPEGDHWLLVRDLDGGLLPFDMLRIRSSELKEKALAARNILIVENERCHHLLPALPDTIAVFGSGSDLSWTTAAWLGQKAVAYWGDIDTWGLRFLATARSHVPHLTALMMDRQVFIDHDSAAVVEPVLADLHPSADLTPLEQDLYRWLTRLELGRLEQEFLLPQVVRDTVRRWVGQAGHRAVEPKR